MTPESAEPRVSDDFIAEAIENGSQREAIFAAAARDARAELARMRPVVEAARNLGTSMMTRPRRRETWEVIPTLVAVRINALLRAIDAYDARPL